MLTIVALKVLLHEKVPQSKQKEIIQLFWWMLVLNDMMNLSANTKRTLQLMDSRIVEFMNLYKKVFGPISALHSQVGLRKVKFHAPKHASFYIRRYGSSNNFFGGNLESALKSTVKAPTKITSHRHDHLSKELAWRQHKRFVCRELRIYISSMMEECHNEANMSYRHRKRRMPAVDNESASASIVTDKPMGWVLHTPVFFPYTAR
jgi:hypothetical protein